MVTSQVDPLRVVLDTNVLVSMLIFRSSHTSWIFPLVRGRRMIPLACGLSILEFLNVLAYPKFQLDHEERQVIAAALLPYVEVIAIDENTIPKRCRDPHDDVFLALAENGTANYLVAGDLDLLELKGFTACPIISPAQLREYVSQ